MSRLRLRLPGKLSPDPCGALRSRSPGTPLQPWPDVVGVEELVPAEDAVEVTDWTSTLPAEDQIVIGIVNNAVDEAVDRTVADLLAAERIRPSSVPVVGFLRDLAKLALGLGLAVMLARARQ